MADDRISVERTIMASPEQIYGLLCDPQGHVAIDSSGMLIAAEGDPVSKVGDSFVVHMDREALNDYPLGQYDVAVVITALVANRQIEWTITGKMRPPLEHVYGYLLEPVDRGTRVTSYYDWSKVDDERKGIFPIISEAALRASLGILARTVARGDSPSST